MSLWYGSHFAVLPWAECSIRSPASSPAHRSRVHSCGARVREVDVIEGLIDANGSEYSLMDYLS